MKIEKLTKEQLIYNICYIIESSATKEDAINRVKNFIDNHSESKEEE